MREMEGDGFKGQLLKVGLVVAFPIWWLVSKSAFEGCQTTLFTLLSDAVENGGYYADCKPSGINSNATQANWNKLW
jgi:hypothetical protein